MDRKEIGCVMEGKTLFIYNIEKDAVIHIFNDQGSLCRERLSDGDSVGIELEDPGVYIVVVQLHDRAVTRKIVRQP